LVLIDVSFIDFLVTVFSGWGVADVDDEGVGDCVPLPEFCVTDWTGVDEAVAVVGADVDVAVTIGAFVDNALEVLSGLFVGTAVGVTIGSFIGVEVTVGSTVASPVGKIVGSVVGSDVECSSGLLVGVAVGVVVGS